MHRLAKWIRCQDPALYYIEEAHFRVKDTHKEEQKDRKRYFK